LVAAVPVGELVAGVCWVAEAGVVVEVCAATPLQRDAAAAVRRIIAFKNEFCMERIFALLSRIRKSGSNTPERELERKIKG
jgi:hypothetical protein